MQFSILGPLDVRSTAGPIQLGGTVRKRLLAILVLGRNRTIPADRLIELLWGDEAPATAANTLQVHVAALRRLLDGRGDPAGLERIGTEGSGYRLVARPGEVDADVFEERLADARRWCGIERARALAEIGASLALWRGEVLADVALPAELLPDVTRLEGLRATALDLSMRLRIGAGDARDAIPDLEALVASDPANESWIGLLMIALYRSSRQADALAVYRTARRRLVEELGLDPSPDLRRLELAILRQDPELANDPSLEVVPAAGASGESSATVDRVPANLTTFIGRAADVREISRLVSDGARLVTIVGIGGSGKSRLALQVAQLLKPAFSGGSRWVELAPLASGDHVPEAFAAAIGVREDVGQGLPSAVAAAVADRHLLLVVDNCEPKVGAVARFVEPLLRASARLVVVATSREPLGLAGEHVWPLYGLALPDESETDPATIRVTEAVALFLDRARSANPRRSLADDELAEVVAIARRLDGLPLALEMAAAWLRVAGPHEIAERLVDPGHVLSLSGSTTVERHRTLRAAFDSSVELLTAPEQAIFRRLAIFAGPASLAGIERVCGFDVDGVPTRLATLVERSLVVAVASGATTRYGLLVPVRDYSRELLANADEADGAVARHLAWAIDLARFEYERRIRDEAAAIRALGVELDELRLALDRSVGVPGAAGEGARNEFRAAGQKLAGLLGWFWPATGRLEEGRAVLGRSLDGAAPADRARLLRGLGYMATYAGDPQLAVVLLTECVTLWRELGEPFEECLALSALGWAHLWPGDNEPALAAFEQGAEIADRIGAAGLRAALLGGAAQTLVAMREIPRARELAAVILAEASPGDLRTLHFGHHFLGDCALLTDDPSTAAIEYAASLELAVALDDPVEICAELQGVAMAQSGLGRATQAVRLFDATEAWLARMGVRILVPFWRALIDEWVGPARASLGSRGEPDGAPLGAAAAVELARSLPTTAPAMMGDGQRAKYPKTVSVPTPPGPGS